MSVFPLALPFIIFNGESFLLPGTPRLRKGYTHEQSSLTCSPIRCPEAGPRGRCPSLWLPVGPHSRDNQGFLSALGLHVGGSKQMSDAL